jgi:putative Ca2+/H+ antiporter (TMEM165/GDT1 family)
VLRLAATVVVASMLGELTDKTMIAALVLARRHRAVRILAAAALGVGAQATLAVVLASLVRGVLGGPDAQRAGGGVLVAAAVVLLVLAWRRRDEAAQAPPADRPFVALVGIFFLAELGDVTQATTASFALASGRPLVVAVAATLGMSAAIGLGALVGTRLAAVPERALLLVAAAVVAVLGIGELTATFAL